MLLLKAFFRPQSSFEKAFLRTLGSTSTTKPSRVLIASIGNPEPAYSGSRHNVGHYLLDKLTKAYWPGFGNFDPRNGIDGLMKRTSDHELENVTFFMSCLTYMNIQGPEICKAWNSFKKVYRGHPTALVIIHDELQIPLGKVQVRRINTSARGHNGLRSIDNSIGKSYTKVAVGIGKPMNKDISDYVLSKFSEEELYILNNDVLPRVSSIILDMSDGKYDLF